jgi:O-antigen/teichoic acid export membrane protein
MVFWTILTWILTPLLIWLFGYNGVAAASFFVTLTISITIYLVKKYIPFSFWASIIKPLLATIIMGCFVFIMTRVFVSNIATLSLCIGLGGILYIAGFYLIARNELYEGITIIRRKYGK